MRDHGLPQAAPSPSPAPLLPASRVSRLSRRAVGRGRRGAGARVQLRLRRGELLPGHGRPAHRPRLAAVRLLHVRAAAARALLHRQPPPGERARPGQTPPPAAAAPHLGAPASPPPHTGCRQRSGVRGTPACPRVALPHHGQSMAGARGSFPVDFHRVSRISRSPTLSLQTGSGDRRRGQPAARRGAAPGSGVAACARSPEPPSA